MWGRAAKWLHGLFYCPKIKASHARQITLSPPVLAKDNGAEAQGF